MKKIALLLVVALVLGVSAVAHAGITKYIFDEEAPQETGEESGFFILNWVNDGKGIIQFQVRGLEPGRYWAYAEDINHGTMIFGELKMNKHGSGYLHYVRYDPQPNDEGVWIGIANTDIGVSNANAVLLKWVDQVP